MVTPWFHVHSLATIVVVYGDEVVYNCVRSELSFPCHSTACVSLTGKFCLVGVLFVFVLLGTDLTAV